ncbi:Marine sediment metagenome DNA, contig: S01H1_L07244 (Fragment) OS=marine sediment metagenome GN=S01H1_17136 PE=4 SV=1 [Gemmata massiliana]|uniref:Marine sediment metagenome DNA, contig: S01H1_L07244 n=1 Tax=Gemmata massiliana TaxID=1210884 RepID=A0A6P2DGH3_9BACT
MHHLRVSGIAFALGLLMSAPEPALAQDDRSPLRLDGLFPVGARTSLTETWGTLRFGVDNWGPTAREARVVVFYPDRPDVQYTRDVWVPGNSRLSSWLTIGPPSAQAFQLRRDIGYRLYERVDGEFRPVASRDPERLVTRAVPYRPREPSTAVYLDDTGDPDGPESVSTSGSAAAQAVLFARTFRHSRGLSEAVSVILDRQLPPTVEAFDGIDQFVLAGNRLTADPAAARTLRRWVLQGGTLWVLLDRVDPTVLAPVLGEALRFEVVGRTSITDLRLRPPTERLEQTDRREFEQPVDLVRVQLSGSETVLYEANGWPAAFSQPVGRGRVVFTTLGGRGWYRPRGPRDPASRFTEIRDVPVSLDALDGLAVHLYPDPQPEPLRTEELAPLLTAEIGYEIAGRGTASAILAAFVLGVLALGLWLRRSRAPERIGLFGPLLALVTAGVFVGVGVASRRAVPPTAASVALVEVTPESGESSWRGMFAVYSPESGGLQVGTDRGGSVELDSTGLDGQTRQRVQTDFDAWHWENLAFPAGVRAGPFRSTNRTGAGATGRFGPNGLDGKLALGTLKNPADAVLFTRAGAALTVRLEPDGSFRTTSNDVLPADQYLSGSVLTDRQQRRQDVYRKLLVRQNSAPTHDRLYVWADADDVPFTVDGAKRTIGSALLSLPIEFAPRRGGELVTIPHGFVTHAAMIDGRPRRPMLEHSESAQVQLRFQLPPSALPFAPERVVLIARVHAPARKFSVATPGDGKPVPLSDVTDANGPVRIEITDPRALRLDPAGGLLLDLAVSERLGPDGRPNPIRTTDIEQARWHIEGLGLEVAGRAGNP